MSEVCRKIAVVQGASSALVQDLFRSLTAHWQSTTSLAGVLAEDHGLPDRACSAGYLRSLRDGAMYPIFQDLGVGSTVCHLAGSDALAAAASVQRDIARGCDLVVLSKFGKLEAAGSGLREAFVAAIDADVPLLTSVSSPFADAWKAFAGSLFVTLPPEFDRIDAWWQTMRTVGRPERDRLDAFKRPAR
jgi:Protein of unknown function (DUF2478)